MEDKRQAAALFRYALIQELTDPELRPRERGALITALAGSDHVSPDGRVMEVLSEHLCEGWLEGYLLTGRHGMFVTYESFAMVSASMNVQHAKWLGEAINLPWRAPVASRRRSAGGRAGRYCPLPVRSPRRSRRRGAGRSRG